MFHSILKFCCRIALHFFFRKWQIHFAAPLPKAPAIFLANHPNTFLDAILIASSIDHKPWFLARGEVFRKKWSAFLVSQFGMLPFYRFRDGYGTLRKNESIITQCAKILTEGGSILIFPEGDNSCHFNLLPLQKGFLKIAEAAVKSDPQLDLQVVPVGIQYSLETKGFGGTALLNFGEPIQFKDFSKENSPEEIVKQTWAKMNSLILHIEENNYEEKLHHLLTHRSNHIDLKKQLEEDLKIIDSYPDVVTQGVRNKNQSVLWQANLIYFKFNHFLLKQLIEFIVSFIREEQMKNSVRFTAGMFLTLPVYLIQSTVIWAATKSLPITAIYFLSLPFSVWARLASDKENIHHHKNYSSL